MATDVFRPRLPLDPFAGIEQPPWRIADQACAHAGPHTILLLGAPSAQDLVPLAAVAAPDSLLVIATHTPPPLPACPAASVIILHLPAPLDIHDSGAVRLVALLDRAQRVVHAWRTHRPNTKIQQFAELYPGGEFSIREEPELAAVASASMPPPNAPHDDTASLDSAWSDVSSSSTRSAASRLFSTKQKSAASRHSQPQFTSLLNFLPPGLPDKALLKHAILVTTLSAPFLAPSVPLSPYPSKSTSRSSIFASLTSLVAPSTRSKPRTRLSSLFASAPPTAFPSPSLAYAHPHSTPASVYSSRESLALAQPSPANPHIAHILPYSASSTSNRPSASSSSSRHLAPPRPSRRPTPHPHTKPKIAQSIEQFLLSFAYPPSTSPAFASPPSSPGTGARSPLRSSPLAGASASPRTSAAAAGSTRRYSALQHPTPARLGVPLPGAHPQNAIPFLLPSGVLGTAPATVESTERRRRCVAELLLSGAMDGAAAGEGWPRAWLASAADIEVVGAPTPFSVPGPGPPPSSYSYSSRREREFGVGVSVGGGVELGVQGSGKGAGGAGNGKGKGKGPARRDSVYSVYSVRRNEAGLPTPPESSGSEDEAEADAPAPSGSVAFHDDVGSRAEAEAEPLARSDAALASTGTGTHAERSNKKGLRLKGRVSRFFGAGETARRALKV